MLGACALRSVIAVFWIALAIARAPVEARGAQSDAADGPQAVVQTFVLANETSNLDDTLTTFADDATAFLPGELPQRITGKAAIRDAFKQIYSRRTGAIRITLSDTSTQLFGDTAVVTAHLGTMPALPVAQSTTFARRTFVLRRIAGRWLIVHLHASTAVLAPPR